MAVAVVVVVVAVSPGLLAEDLQEELGSALPTALRLVGVYGLSDGGLTASNALVKLAKGLAL